MPDPHDQNVASQATRPTENDVAIAEEAILGALAEGRVAHVTNMIEVVGTRFADEPTPGPFAQLQDVTEEDCRAAWMAATAMTALANLQWTGQIIPCDSLDVPNLPQLSLQWRSSHGAGAIRNMQPEYAFPVGRQLRIAPWLKAVGPDSLALLRTPVAGAGEKVTRVLREAADTSARRAGRLSSRVERARPGAGLMGDWSRSGFVGQFSDQRFRLREKTPVARYYALQAFGSVIAENGNAVITVRFRRQRAASIMLWVLRTLWVLLVAGAIVASTQQAVFYPFVFLVAVGGGAFLWTARERRSDREALHRFVIDSFPGAEELP